MFTTAGHRGRDTRDIIASLSRRRTELVSYQTRTCARCGRLTVFVLEDPSGGWYACSECGRFA